MLVGQADLVQWSDSRLLGTCTTTALGSVWPFAALSAPGSHFLARGRQSSACETALPCLQKRRRKTALMKKPAWGAWPGLLKQEASPIPVHSEPLKRAGQPSPLPFVHRVPGRRAQAEIHNGCINTTGVNQTGPIPPSASKPRLRFFPFSSLRKSRSLALPQSRCTDFPPHPFGWRLGLRWPQGCAQLPSCPTAPCLLPPLSPTSCSLSSPDEGRIFFVRRLVGGSAQMSANSGKNLGPAGQLIIYGPCARSARWLWSQTSAYEALLR